MINPEQAKAGQAIYTKITLLFYDFWVLGVSNSLIWKCPTPVLLEQYNQLVTANHLDVGVGTGYFLDRCKFPSHSPRVALMDLNENSLGFTQERIARYTPEVYKHNILEPVGFEIQPFDSIGINYLLHCLPGTMATKEIVFQYLKPLLNSGGILFGATLLQGGVQRNFAARQLMQFYNSKGVFSNTADDLETLTKNLEANFSQVSVKTQGCVALFWGRK